MSSTTRPDAVTTWTRVPSPIGQLLLTASDGVLSRLWMEEQRHQTGSPDDTWRSDDDGFVEVRAQLGAYFAGELRDFTLPLAPEGTPFQLEVWEALRTIPYGETCSYGEIAQQLGKPGASRAVGLANGRNPISVVVPCHRVIGSNGSLTGYGGGLARKQWLLDHERGSGQLALAAG